MGAQAKTFIEHSIPFIEWMLKWQANLKPAPLVSLSHNGDPRSVGILSVDVIDGFCTVGPLSSPRVNQIVKPITRFFQAAGDYGGRYIFLTQDTHLEDAVK